MTATEKARKIVVSTVGEQNARRIMAALEKARIGFLQHRGSPEMLTRFSAHARYLAGEIGETENDLRQQAKQYAMERVMWPTKTFTTKVKVLGGEIQGEVTVPLTATVATNDQLMCAYEYIQFVAEEHKVRLPENVHA